MRKKVLDPYKHVLDSYKHVSDNSRKCLSVGNFRILFDVGLSVCDASTAYTSSCRGLKYLLKLRYIIILNYPNVA